MAAGATFGGNGPAERARAARKLLRRCELRNRNAAQDAMMRIDTAIQQHLAERGEIGRGAKNAGVPGDAADGERVFVMHFALHKAVTQIVANLCRSNPWPKFLGWPIHRV